MNEPQDKEFQSWDAECRVIYHTRIGCLIGAANPIPEDADDIARMEVRGYLLAKRKRNTNTT